ncbi:MAG TPA: DEAD/DEAH box helicase [Propionibacterium sp.]|nr:DEAD/DEAH box helicase [Propionibacterium sp.]
MSGPQAFAAAPVLSGLTQFQRNTVEHVISRFYGPDAGDRFLVADETGLGKTIVARGVIARTIEELQHRDEVDRIDIVYVCSNQDLAQQNLSKLNVTGGDHHGIASRLTLLAKHAHRFAPPGADQLVKPVNLVSFTPGTSFSKGWSTGTAEERAMLFLLLQDTLRLRGKRRVRNAQRVLQGGLATPERLAAHVSNLSWGLKDGIDPAISDAFLAAAGHGEPSLLDEFAELVEPGNASRKNWDRRTSLVGELRTILARESVRLLTPDLVILDEFQRFRELLDPASEAGELAHHLFGYNDGRSGHGAKVLLLSATPFKPFTYAEEARVGDDHHRDFLEVVKFLANGNESDTTQGLATALAEYRSAVVTGKAESGLTESVRAQMLRFMTRTERPRGLAARMSCEVSTELGNPSEDDLIGFVALRRLARHLDAPFPIDYWKSAPYFINFMDGYRIAQSIRGALEDPTAAPTVAELMRRTQRIDFEAVNRLDPVPMGNARLRALATETVEAGWWKLLWMPASLPYLMPGGPYAEPFTRSMTKRLIFSSWTATPTAVASLLSYEADRLSAGGKLGATPEDRTRERNSRRSRLAYRIDREGERDRPSSMSTLALFWPMPGLAAIADPRSAVLHREAPEGVDADRLAELVAARLKEETAGESPREGGGPLASHWFEALRRPDSYPHGLNLKDVLQAVSGASDGEDDRLDPPESSAADAQRNDLRARHVELAFQIRGAAQDRVVTDETRATVAAVAAHGPGNIAYRALQRVTEHHADVTPAGLWVAAARLASALRTLFSRPETTLLLDELTKTEESPDTPYWRNVLTYCAWGNLQSVLDEYVHHLHVAQGGPALDDGGAMALAQSAARALELRSASYDVFDPDDPAHNPKFWARFALRFGGRREGQESARQPVVREAFNSPFWPFVLATTSVGQEGVDFHWWSHAVLHWNTPANPIDFEQREGRVDRYDGHAVRRNIAARHRAAILASEEPNPWRAAYELARDEVDRLGEFAPHWVYPGEALIERHVVPYPLSIDEVRLADIKRDVALYRLTFGQPRQEDMLELLRRHFSDATPEELESLRLDLSAPPRSDGPRNVGPT